MSGNTNTTQRSSTTTTTHTWCASLARWRWTFETKATVFVAASQSDRDRSRNPSRLLSLVLAFALSQDHVTSRDSKPASQPMKAKLSLSPLLAGLEGQQQPRHTRCRLHSARPILRRRSFHCPVVGLFMTGAPSPRYRGKWIELPNPTAAQVRHHRRSQIPRPRSSRHASTCPCFYLPHRDDKQLVLESGNATHTEHTQHTLHHATRGRERKKKKESRSPSSSDPSSRRVCVVVVRAHDARCVRSSVRRDSAYRK